jgi:hypothetical protein
MGEEGGVEDSDDNDDSGKVVSDRARYQVLLPFKKMMKTLLATSRCQVEGCYSKYDVVDQEDEHYPYISAKCSCTICKKCLEEQVVKVCRGDLQKTKWPWIVPCPLCDMEHSFENLRRIPNYGVSSVCEQMAQIMESLPRGPSDEGEEKGTKKVEEEVDGSIRNADPKRKRAERESDDETGLTVVGSAKPN